MASMVSVHSTTVTLQSGLALKVWQYQRRGLSWYAVVFGKVVEGMALVRKAEAVGTQSGKPRQPVVVADCGEVCQWCAVILS